jgi:hypothetical protein
LTGGKGIYVDFNKNWYINAAPSLVITMLTTAFLPWIEVFMFYLLGKFNQGKDRCCARNCRKDAGENKDATTMKNNITEYIDLYSGPVYLMHFKYSSILC